MRLLRRKWKGLLKFIGPILFIYLIIRVVDPRTTANILIEIQPLTAILSIFLFPLLIFTLTARWRMICRWLEMEVPFIKLFHVHYISWFLGLIPFIGISQVAKFVYLREDKKAAGPIAASITLDKVFDVLGHVLFGLFAFVYFPRSYFQDKYIWFILAVVLLIIVVTLLFWNKLWILSTNFLKKLTSKKLQRLGENLEINLSQSWSQFNWKFFTLIFGISIVIGILRSLALFLLALSLNINVTFGFMVACRALIGIVNVVPVTVNGLGTRDAILLFTFPLINASSEAAVALSFLAFLWILCFRFSGIFFWLKNPLPVRSRNLSPGK